MDDVLLAEVTRNDLVECRHYGSAVVLDPTGAPTFEIGNPRASTYGRSANKMMQAVAMLNAGLQVSQQQLALTTASHSGSPEHIEIVQSILTSYGLHESHLKNAIYPPYGKREYEDLLRHGGVASTLTMNCSGKHASMVATCAQNHWDVESYLDPQHALQKQITESLDEWSGEPTSGAGVDGCGAPAHRLTLTALARSLTRMVTADSGTSAARVMEAIRTHPHLAGGHDRDVTVFLQHAPGWVGKDGADGVMVLASPLGHSVAVKVIDGAERPRIPVAIAVLKAAGVDVPELPRHITHPPVLGGGNPVGLVSPVTLAH